MAQNLLLPIRIVPHFYPNNSRHPVLDTGSISATTTEFQAWIPYQVRDDDFLLEAFAPHFI